MDGLKNGNLNAWQFLMELHTVCHFMSRERKGKASNSELKRWLKNQAVVVNGSRIKWDTEIDFNIESFVLFPKNPVTLF